MRYGVYYVPTKQASIFSNLKMELIASFETKEEADNHCLHMNMCDDLDDLHDGYTVRPLPIISERPENWVLVKGDNVPIMYDVKLVRETPKAVLIQGTVHSFTKEHEFDGEAWFPKSQITIKNSGLPVPSAIVIDSWLRKSIKPISQ